MKHPFTVLRDKELKLADVRKEVQALRLAAPLLADDRDLKAAMAKEGNEEKILLKLDRTAAEGSRARPSCASIRMNSSGERRSLRRDSCNIRERRFCPGWGFQKQTTFGIRPGFTNDLTEPCFL